MKTVGHPTERVFVQSISGWRVQTQGPLVVASGGGGCLCVVYTASSDL